MNGAQQRFMINKVSVIDPLNANMLTSAALNADGALRACVAARWYPQAVS